MGGDRWPDFERMGLAIRANPNWQKCVAMTAGKCAEVCLTVLCLIVAGKPKKK
jgi:hypothetical protein